jgi:hypothetical protein
MLCPPYRIIFCNSIGDVTTDNIVMEGQLTGWVTALAALRWNLEPLEENTSATFANAKNLNYCVRIVLFCWMNVVCVCVCACV